MKAAVLPVISSGLSRHGGRGVSCAWLALLLLLTHLVGSNAATTLRLVQVVHRHGSRSAIVSYNQSEICDDVPCGYLNVPGRTMMVNTGAFLRERYNNDATVVSTPFFPSESYNLDVSYTRSTDVLRTLQSAEGLLRGLFPDMTTFYPAVHTVDSSTDLLLRTEIVPYPYIIYSVNKKGTNAVCNPWVDAVIDFPTLLSVAKEVYSEGYCADAENRCYCVNTLFDIGAALAATGRIANFPLMQAHLNDFRSVVVRFWQYEFGYNTSEKVNRKMGSQGQNVAQQMLANAQQHMQGKSTFKLYHYSAHDTTLGPLSATFRDSSSGGMLPPFAQLYALELLYNDETNAYSMRVLRGHPGQTPDTNYAFSWETDFQLRCMNSNGELYDAPGNTCPFYDFQRMVDSSKPEDAAGLCYLDDDYKSKLGCPTGEGGSLTTPCKRYRTVCPAWSCGSGFTLDSLTLQCKCSDSSCMKSSNDNDGATRENNEKKVSAGAAAGIAIATFAVGAVIVLVVFFVLLLRRGGGAKNTPLHNV